jgi:hypothetical protein
MCFLDCSRHSFLGNVLTPKGIWMAQQSKVHLAVREAELNAYPRYRWRIVVSPVRRKVSTVARSTSRRKDQLHCANRPHAAQRCTPTSGGASFTWGDATTASRDGNWACSSGRSAQRANRWMRACWIALTTAVEMVGWRRTAGGGGGTATPKREG